MKYSGFRLIEEDINIFLKNGRNIEFLLGLDFQTTEPKILRILNKLYKEGLPVRCYCFSDPLFSNAPVYHPKLYLINNENSTTITIGSSNLTGGGFKKI